MAHLHPVYDTDPHFSIDSTTRAITYESKDKLVLVQGDHNSQRYTFEVPRYVDGHDMMLCDSVRIHYINISSGSSRSRENGVYEVTDMQVAPDDEQGTVVLSWLVSCNATKYVGTLNFVIRFACTSESEIEYAWSTTIFNAVAIIASIDNGELVVEQYADILEQWYNDLVTAGTASVDAIHKERDQAIEDIDTKKASVISDIGTTKDDAITAIGTAKTAAIDNVNSTRDGAVEAIGTAKTTAIDSVQSEVAERTDEYFNSLQNGAYKIIEQNVSKKVDFWFGTQAELDAIPVEDRATDRVYIPSDDTTLDEIDQKFESIINGTQPVGQATNAGHATTSDSATEAGSADYATNAGAANTAVSADKASILNNGEVIFNATQQSDCPTSIEITSPGLYIVNSYSYMDTSGTASGGPITFWLLITDLNTTCESTSHVTVSSATYAPGYVYTAVYTPANGIRVEVKSAGGSKSATQYYKIMTVSKVMSFDNVVVNTITFKIGDVACTAKRGMTWYEYANSSYPAQAGITLTCTATSSIVKYGESSGMTYVYLGSAMVKGSDAVTPGANYVTISG